MFYCYYLFVSEGNASFGEVVGGHFDLNLVAGEDFDVVHPHFSGNAGRDDMAVFQTDAEHRVSQGFNHFAVLLDKGLFWHIVLFLSLIVHSQRLFYVLVGGNNLGLSLGVDGDLVFVVCRRLPVGRTDGPAVLVLPDLMGARRNHRLDTEDHAGADHFALSRLSVVGDVGGLVHLPSDAVPAEFADDAVVVRLQVTFNRMADVADAFARHRELEGFVEGCLRALHQEPLLLRHLADGEGVGEVPVPASDTRHAVGSDDVALLEDIPVGDSVDNHVIHRQAEGGGVRDVAASGAVALAGRDPVVVADEILRHPVDVVEGDAGLHQFCNLTQGFSNKQRTFLD